MSSLSLWLSWKRISMTDFTANCLKSDKNACNLSFLINYIIRNFVTDPGKKPGMNSQVDD